MLNGDLTVLGIILVAFLGDYGFTWSVIDLSSIARTGVFVKSISSCGSFISISKVSINFGSSLISFFRDGIVSAKS